MNMPVLSSSDATQNDEGKWSVQFQLPSSGQRLVASANTAELAVDFANEQIRQDQQSQEAEKKYREGVKVLSQMCLTHDGPAASAAAQVLLSAYDSSTFQVKTTALCMLDGENLEHALAILRGRVVCMIEPHQLLDEGQDVFDRLYD